MSLGRQGWARLGKRCGLRQAPSSLLTWVPWDHSVPGSFPQRHKAGAGSADTHAPLTSLLRLLRETSSILGQKSSSCSFSSLPRFQPRPGLKENTRYTPTLQWWLVFPRYLLIIQKRKKYGPGKWVPPTKSNWDGFGIQGSLSESIS